MKPLTIKQVESARVMILANAESLLCEAILLFENGYYARAYTLAHYASEEIVKIPMIVRAVVDETAGIGHDWKKLNKRLTSHTTKIYAGHMHDYIRTKIMEDESDIEAYEQALTTTSDLNDTKNNSLYCGFNSGEPFSPIETITMEMAEESIRRSQSRLELIKAGEERISGKLAETLTEEYLEKWRETHARMDQKQ